MNDFAGSLGPGRLGSSSLASRSAVLTGIPASGRTYAKESRRRRAAEPEEGVQAAANLANELSRLLPQTRTAESLPNPRRSARTAALVKSAAPSLGS
jgi:hypothetical protein